MLILKPGWLITWLSRTHDSDLRGKILFMTMRNGTFHNYSWKHTGSAFLSFQCKSEQLIGNTVQLSSSNTAVQF